MSDVASDYPKKLTNHVLALDFLSYSAFVTCDEDLTVTEVDGGSHFTLYGGICAATRMLGKP